MRHCAMKSLNSGEYLSGLDSFGGGLLGMLNKTLNENKKQEITTNLTLIGGSFAYGGFFSANSIAVIPIDHISTLNLSIRLKSFELPY